MWRRALIVLALAALSAPATASAARRTTVALVGDSIVESSHVPDPRTEGLAPAVRRSLRRLGFDTGGEGFIAAHPAEDSVVVGAHATAGGWSYRGGWLWFTAPGLPGTLPLFSWTVDPMATASLRARADTARIVYLTGPAMGRFAFEVAGTRGEVDARQPRAASAIRTVRLPSSRRPRSIRVGDVQGGAFGLVGVFLRRAPVGGRRQLEVSALGYAGTLGSQPEDPAAEAGLAAIAPGVTVLVLGTNDAIVAASTGDRRIYPRLERGILARARVARRSGACIVVPPGRGRLPLDVFRGVRAAERRAARRGGCSYAPVLDVLGSRRYFTLDGVHPDALGYRVVARRLAPVIASAAR